MQKKQQQQIPSDQMLKAKWKKFFSAYVLYDTCPNTFFYTLYLAKNILEVACGAGRLLPYALQLKNPEAAYYGTDLSLQMIQVASQRLRANFERYKSKLSFEQWIQKQKLVLQQADAQQLYDKGIKFDRIIANLIVMIVPDTQKMIKNLSLVAEEGCLLGITIWGDPAKNNLLNVVTQTFKEAGLEPPKNRTNFHLYNNIEKLLQKCGWEVILNWQQNAPFSILQLEQDNQTMKNFLYSSFDSFQPEVRDIVIPIAAQKYKKAFQSNQGLQFYTQMLIVRKKSII